MTVEVMPFSQKDLSLRIRMLTEKQRERYYQLLESERSKVVSKGGRLVPLPDRYVLIDIVSHEGNCGQERTFGADTVQVRLKWERAGGDRNPPMKGAKDD
jgi:hypothetical protein